MARDSRWSNDLAALAEDERRRLGEPPTAEQLIAYRDGELPEAEAERIRDRLAVDPEWAAIYLDLKRSDAEVLAAEVPGGAVSDAEVDGGWRALAVEMGSAAPAIAAFEQEPAEIPTGRRRQPYRRFLAMAATLVFGLGLVWFLAGPDRQEPLPDGSYQPARVISDRVRSSVLSVRHGVVGLEFLIEGSEFSEPGEYHIELLGSLDAVIRSQSVTVEAGQAEVSFRVASTDLEEGNTYHLTVRQAGASRSAPALINFTFTPTFEVPEAQSEVPEAQSDLSEAPPDPCSELDLAIDHASSLRKDGNWRAAEAAYFEVRDRVIAVGCPYQQVRIQNGLGALATREGRLVEGLDLLRKASEALSGAVQVAGVDDERAQELEATIKLNQGGAYLRLSWLNEALGAFKSTETLYRRHGAEPERWSALQLQLARVYRLRGETEKAKTAIQKALALEVEKPKLRAALWQESARLDLGAERFDAAERALDKAAMAVELQSDAYAKASVFSDRAQLEVRRRDWAAAQRWVSRALELAVAAKKPDLHLEAQARYVQALALEGLGRTEEARRASDNGLALLGGLRSVWQDQGIQFFALRQEYYRHRLDLAAAGQGAKDAWEVIESHRAQGLLDGTAARGRQSGEGLAARDSDALDESRRALLESIRELDDWEPSAGEEVRSFLEARFLARRLDVRSAQAAERRAAGLRPLPVEVDPAKAGELLDAETLGLVFAGGKSGFYVLTVARHRELEILALDIARRRLLDLVAHILKSLDPHAPRGAWEAVAPRLAELSRGLLAPLDELDGFRRLVVAAEGALAKLPFETVRHPRTGRPLLDSHEVVYVPSFSVLGTMRTRSCLPPASELLAIGDPILSSKDLRWPRGVDDPRNPEDARALYPLPATSGEVKAIAELYPGGESFSGPDATRQRFLAEVSSHRTIHVASHAWSDPKQPEHSKVALSCVSADGRAAETCDLYFADVLTLELCGQIVVLSACTTAGGPTVEGEGTLGLPWAFLRAGASAVVASLWQVTDQSTAELMSTFHRYLASGLGPATALRQAKLELAGTNRPPSAWAPFVLLGDWRR